MRRIIPPVRFSVDATPEPRDSSRADQFPRGMNPAARASSFASRSTVTIYQMHTTIDHCLDIIHKLLYENPKRIHGV